MSNHYNCNHVSNFNYAFPSGGYNPFPLNSILNESRRLDISQITYEERRRNLSPYLLQLQNIRDNLPYQYQPPPVFLETKPNMDHFFTPNIPQPNGTGSSLNQLQIQPAKPNFLSSKVALFNQAYGPNFSGNQSLQLHTTPSPNSIGGATRDELLVSPLHLSVQYPFQMKDENSSSDHYQAVAIAKTSIPQNQVTTNSSFGMGVTNNIPDAENKVIRRIRNDGRIHSLPHKKYGPYYCPFPECKGLIFPTSQVFGAHTQAYHYSGETVKDKKRRQQLKYGTRKRNLSLGLTKDGCITVMPNSLNYRPVRAGRIEKSSDQNQVHSKLFDQYVEAIKQGILNSVNTKREPIN